MSQDQQNQNDIDQILNEVEELRRELNTEAKAVDTQAVAEEIVSHLAPEAAAPVPTLAQATEVAKELAALVDASVAAPAPEAEKVEAAVASVAPAAPTAVAAPAAEDDLMKEFHASLEQTDDSGESLESTLAELKDDPSVKTLLDQTFDDQARRQQETVVAQVPSHKESPSIMKNEHDETSNESSPSLTMSLTGSMTLRLKYEFAGQEVTVGFTDEYLKVELADGTEFKIPVGRQKTLRRVA